MTEKKDELTVRRKTISKKYNIKKKTTSKNDDLTRRLPNRMMT